MGSLFVSSVSNRVKRYLFSWDSVRQLVRLISQKDLGVTSVDKIGEVQLSDEILEGGFEILKKPNFKITIRYKIPNYLSVGTFFKEEGRGLENFSKKLKF